MGRERSVYEADLMSDDESESETQQAGHATVSRRG
jgi:hypothetical protein